ncbi:MAG TPA: phosphatidate cytidylyltransferase [Treponema sp.]|nr:phosphatidate cytidylyltransferase [Treponema sp.]
MTAKQLISRLSVFFIGVPLVLLIIFLPYYNHIVLQICLCVVSGFAASELYDIFSVRTKLYSRVFTVICTMFIPLVAAVYEVAPAFTHSPFAVGEEVITYAMIVSFLAVLCAEVLSAGSFEESNARMAATLFTAVYAGYLLTFVSRMAGLRHQGADGQDIAIPAIMVFILMVFFCDSFAWLFGILLGKNNRGVIKASPNKSIAGFTGGFLGSIAAGFAGAYVFPGLFPGSPLKLIVLSLCIAFAAIVGDLAESVFKRSAGIKDSGHIVPGRGGILDSIDSILMAAPVYYLLFALLYGRLA